MLHDEVRRRPDAADRQEDVVGHEVGGEPLDLLGEGGGEEQRRARARGGHVLLRRFLDRECWKGKEEGEIEREKWR